MKQTILKTGTILLLLGAMVTGCEKIDTDDSWSFTQLRINVVYADAPYLFTYNGEAIPPYISRRDTVGRLCAYRDEEMLELDTVLHFRPGSTLTFIQLPGETMKFYNPGEAESEPEPANSTRTKLRFVYTDGDGIPEDSLRLIWISSSVATLNLPGAKSEAFDTLIIEKGHLSRYMEFDTEKYREEGKNVYYYCTQQVWKDGAWANQRSRVSVFRGNLSMVDMNQPPVYKFATHRIYIYGDGSFRFGFLFGTEW